MITNLRFKSLAGAAKSSSSPRSDNEGDFSAEFADESEESVTLSATDDSIETESPEIQHNARALLTFQLTEMHNNSRLCDRLRSSAITWKHASTIVCNRAIVIAGDRRR